MRRFIDALPDWPSVFAVTACTMMALASAQEDLGFDLVGFFSGGPGTPDTPKKPDVAPAPPKKVQPPKKEAAPKPPKPDTTKFAPYAPAPGRDDRTPIEYADLTFGLNDPAFANKMSGVGPVYWKGSGRGTGALISRDVVLTTAHLFVKNGDWYGAHGAVPVPPPPSNGWIYLAACKQSYKFTAIEVGSTAPRKRLGLDYAIAKLAKPACAAATILPVMETPDDLASLKAKDSTVINIGAYEFADLPRYAKHPFFTSRKKQQNGMHRLHVFAVRCAVTGFDNTGDVAGGSTGVVITRGCDGVPGGSGGPLVAAFNGGKDYKIIGVANSYRKTDPEYNNYTRIEGTMAGHIANHVRLIAAVKKTNAPITKLPANPQGGGGWHAMMKAQPNIMIERAMP